MAWLPVSVPARGFWTGWAVVGRELRVIVSHATRVDVSAACCCWWTTSKSTKLTTSSSKMHNYRQGSRRCRSCRPLPTDVEAECQSETDGSERRDGSKRRGTSEQRGRRATCPSTPPLSRWSSRRVNSLCAKLPTPPKDHSAPICIAVLRLLPRSWWLLLLLCSSTFCVNFFWLLFPSPRCFTIPLGR